MKNTINYGAILAPALYSPHAEQGKRSGGEAA